MYVTVSAKTQLAHTSMHRDKHFFLIYKIMCATNKYKLDFVRSLLGG